MSVKSLILSSAGLKNVIPNINNKENEFLFIFGEEKIRMSKINAEFISPLISHLHQSDPTIEQYKYPSDDTVKEIFTKEILSKFKSLCQGESIEIDIEESKKLEVISHLLCNEELQTKVLELYPVNYSEKNMKEILHEFSIDEYIHRHVKSSMKCCQNKIEYIASNFYKLNKEEIEELTKLPKYLLYSIVSCPALKLLNEDSLFEFIENIFHGKVNSSDDENDMINEFYETIEIENLSFDKFIKMIEKINENNMTRTIWEKLKHILISQFKPNLSQEIKSSRYIKQQEEKSQENQQIGQEIEYNGNESGAFKGIIANLTNKCGGNVSDKNEVKVTSNSVWNGEYYAKYVVDLEDSQHYFASNGEQNSWIKYDLKDKKVRPTRYSIRTHHISGHNNCHLQNWVIEGSNTDQDDDWKMLDSRSDITVLNDANRMHTFDIKEKLESNEFFRYLRLRQTGVNTGSGHYLNISALEYFGKII